MTAPAYPNLHRIAYGEGARLTAEARVEAADALERLNRRCDGCRWGVRVDDGPLALSPPSTLVRCFAWSITTPPSHVCGDWAAQPLTPAHDKEKS